MSLEYLKMFYYDTAGGNHEALQLCESILDENRILFGTDHPYLESAEHVTIEYINRTKITKKQERKIYFKNAATLFKKKLVAYILDIGFEDLSKGAVKTIKDVILTVLSITIAGATAEGCEVLVNQVKE